MAIEAKTIFASVDVSDNGVVTATFLKQLVNSDVIMASENHLFPINPPETGVDVATLLADGRATLNADLDRMGYPPVPDDGWAKVVAHAGVAFGSGGI